MTDIAPTLVFGWGNPSRGDDALGPKLLDALQSNYPRHPAWGMVEFITDFQLAVEHVLDLKGRRRVLFTDAHAGLSVPCSITCITPGRDGSFTSHSLSPQALLQVYVELEGNTPPPCSLLAMRAESMELGATLSTIASQSLHHALDAATQWLNQPLTDLPHEH